jgi:hypothetical protein
MCLNKSSINSDEDLNKTKNKIRCDYLLEKSKEILTISIQLSIIVLIIPLYLSTQSIQSDLSATKNQGISTQSSVTNLISQAGNLNSLILVVNNIQAQLNSQLTILQVAQASYESAIDSINNINTLSTTINQTLDSIKILNNTINSTTNLLYSRMGFLSKNVNLITNEYFGTGASNPTKVCSFNTTNINSVLFHVEMGVIVT